MYFYLPSLHSNQLSIQITDTNDFHHIIHVLRKKKSALLWLTNGEGILVQAKITEIHDKNQSIVCDIEKMQIYPNPSFSITTCMAFIRKTKFEEALPKLVECNGSHIIGYPARYSNFFNDPKISSSKKKSFSAKDFDLLAIEKYKKRWIDRVEESCKQCQRVFFPKITIIPSLQKYLLETRFDALFILNETSGMSPKESLNYIEQRRDADSPLSIGLIIGPEAGFDAEEVASFETLGALSVHYSKSILRSETAAVAFTSFYSLYFSERTEPIAQQNDPKN